MSYFPIHLSSVKSLEEDAFLRLSNNIERCSNLLINNKVYDLSAFFIKKSDKSIMLPLIAKNHYAAITHEDRRKLQRYLTAYKRNILNYLHTIPHKSLSRTYEELCSIDPILIGRKRYKPEEFLIKKILKVVYYVLKSYLFKKRIVKYENRITILSFLEKANKNLKKICEVSKKFLETSNSTVTLKDLVNKFISAQCKEEAKELKNYIKKYIDKDMHYLLDPEVLILLDSILNDWNSNTPGIAAHNENIGSPVVTFSSSSNDINNLKNDVPLSVGLIDETQFHMKEWNQVESSGIRIVPTNHCADTQQWRKKLILAAQHNILISGNYCSGKAFDEILELIKTRLEENTELKVIILCHPDFIVENKNIRNISLLEELTKTYPKQFSLIPTGLVTINDKMTSKKTATNHTKYLGVDYGRYFILGGSGIKDNFNFSGVDNYLSLLGVNFVEEFTQLNSELLQIKKSPKDKSLQKILQVIEFAELVKEKLLRHTHYSAIETRKIIQLINKNITLLQEAVKNSIFDYKKLEKITSLMASHKDNHSASDTGILKWIIPGNFRDMDFVFSDPGTDHSTGRKCFIEAVRLAYRWESLNEARNPARTLPLYSPKKVSLLPIFTGKKKVESTADDSVIRRIMKEPMLKPSFLKTGVITEEFNISPAEHVQILSQGPENAKGESKFAAKTLELIKRAKKNILFNHMYFCPTREIMEALRNAAERGIKIEIITSGVTKNCTNSQLCFGNYNQWHWVQLCSMIRQECRDNVNIYLYEQNKKALHKKVIIIDDEIVLAGSSNFGYKSLVCSSDFEINFVATSQAFTQKTRAICEEDKALSKKIEHKTRMSINEYIKAFLYSLSKEKIN